jgi:hypothetical protein
MVSDNSVNSLFAVDDMQESHQLTSFLFSKYPSLNHLVISDFTYSIPNNFSDAVTRTLYTSNSINDDVLSNRIKLKKFIEKFHTEAGTINADIYKTIELLTDPSTKIFVSAHQPNLFPYGGVFKKIVLLQTLKNAIMEKQAQLKNIINLFLVVDSDFLDETWIRIAQLPSVKHKSGILELRLPVSKSERWQMACTIPIPKRTILEYWRKQITSWIADSSALGVTTSRYNKSNLLSNFEEFWQQVELAYSKAKSYADFNSFLMSQIVNKVWGYDTLFVRLTDISPVFEDGFKYLISNFKAYSDSLRKAEDLFLSNDIDTGISSSSYINAPLWVHCNKCGSKASVNINKKQMEQGGEIDKSTQPEFVTLDGNCTSCKRHLQVNLGKKGELELLKQKEVIYQLSPRAIPIILLLSRELGIMCYVSGTAGIRYILYGSLAFKQLSSNIPLTLVWPSKDVYYGIGQSEALELVRLAKHSEVVPYLELLKQKEAEYNNKLMLLICERSNRVNTGEPVQTLLSDIVDLKEECRRIRHLITILDKVKNAVNLSPCFIDYAVNFGMINTEKQWRQNLLNSNSLSIPLIIIDNKRESNYS